MLTLRPELSNLDACEVRETPLTWQSTTGALAYLSLFIIVRRAKAKWQRPQGPVARPRARPEGETESERQRARPRAEGQTAPATEPGQAWPRAGAQGLRSSPAVARSRRSCSLRCRPRLSLSLSLSLNLERAVTAWGLSLRSKGQDGASSFTRPWSETEPVITVYWGPGCGFKPSFSWLELHNHNSLTVLCDLWTGGCRLTSH